MKKIISFKGIVAAVFCLFFFGVMMHTSFFLPTYNEIDSPVFNHVASRYMAKSEEETDSPNMVTAVLADYRGFDTLGETTVIFTAGAVTFVLVLTARKKKNIWEVEP